MDLLFKQKHPEIENEVCSFHSYLTHHVKLYGNPTFDKRIRFNYPSFIERYIDVVRLVNDDIEYGYIRVFKLKNLEFEELIQLKQKDIYYDTNDEMYVSKDFLVVVLNLD